MRNWVRLFLKIFFSASIICAQLPAPGAVSEDRSADGRIRRGEHVVVVVWDGMRPDFISAQYTPTLWKLAQSGVFFRRHHSVYPSATVVNGTALMTGVYPNHSGILANHAYRPDIDAKKSVDVENVAVVRKGDEVSAGKYVGASTLPEILHEHGKNSVVATAKTVGLLFDRHADGRSGKDVFAGQSIPHDATVEIVKALGAFPPATEPARRDEWTTKALTEFLWKDGVPGFSLLWLSEPDDTEHRTAPGDPAAIAAIKSSDENLARVLAALDQRQARSTTDVFVVSDHGFSTIARSIDVRKILRDAGFDAVTEFASEAKPGQIMIAGNGGTVMFYVIGHDEGMTRKLVEFLEQTDFAGMIFSKNPMPGAIRLEDARIDDEHAADVVMAFRWREDKNQFGAQGMIDADWQRAAGKGTHATLSDTDMHNILIAAGPDFQKGLTSDLPSGNVDLAPTVLRVFGIAGARMDGRALTEAMTSPEKPEPSSGTAVVGNTLPSGKWNQVLKYSQVGSTIYFEAGNGGFTRSP